MRRSKYTEEQIALKRAELGTPVGEVIRKMRYGHTEQTYYRWKKYGGIGMSELRMTVPLL